MTEKTPSIQELLANYRRAVRLVYQVEHCGCVSCFDNQYELKTKEETACEAILDHPAVRRGIAELNREENLLKVIRETTEEDDGIPF